MQKLLGTTDVARRLGVSPPTVCRYVDIGELNATRTQSGRRVYTERDVERFIARRKAREATDPARPNPVLIGQRRAAMA